MNPARPDLTAMFLTGHILDRGLTNSNPGGHSLCHLCLRGVLLDPTPLPSVNLVRKLTGQWDP